jgi:hypothetical protein
MTIGALALAGMAGGLALFSIGGSRRLSSLASRVLTWLAPIYFLTCCGVAGAVRVGATGEIAVVVAWAVVAAIVLGFYSARALGLLPLRGPPGSSERE